LLTSLSVNIEVYRTYKADPENDHNSIPRGEEWDFDDSQSSVASASADMNAAVSEVMLSQPKKSRFVVNGQELPVGDVPKNDAPTPAATLPPITSGEVKKGRFSVREAPDIKTDAVRKDSNSSLRQDTLPRDSVASVRQTDSPGAEEMQQTTRTFYITQLNASRGGLKSRPHRL
jgi:hypothetical protein